MQHHNEFAKDLQLIIETLDISESFLAKELKINTPSISNWLKGKYQPDPRSKEDVYRYAYENNLRINLAHEVPFRSLLKKNDQILVFHGSRKNITTELSLNNSNNLNDFGIGFYTCENYTRAAEFIADYPDSTVYAYGARISDLNIKHFDIDISWILTIACYRGYLKKYQNSIILNELISETLNCDLIIAPLANNRTFDLVRQFTDGQISSKACISALSALDLGKQYVFKTEEALSRISYLRQFYLCKNEKKEILDEANSKHKQITTQFNDIYRQFRNGRFIEEIMYERN